MGDLMATLKFNHLSNMYLGEAVTQGCYFPSSLITASPPWGMIERMIDKKQSEEIKEYNLVDNFLISYNKKETSWTSWYNNNLVGGKPKLYSITGKGYTRWKLDVLVLGSYNIRSADDQFKTMDEVIEYLKSLPKWDKTRYFVKVADIDVSPIMICSRNEPASDKIQKRILPKLDLRMW